MAFPIQQAAPSVVSSATGAQFNPHVAALKGGGWVAVWETDQNGPEEIYQSVYGPDGAALADPQLIEDVLADDRDPWIGSSLPFLQDPTAPMGDCWQMRD